jgi:hypothetical protein
MLLLFVGVVCAVNLLWLRYSSTKIVVGHRGVAEVQLHVDDELIDIGNLRTGETRFLFLPRKGKSSLFTVSFVQDEMRRQVCVLDVESSMQHVGITLYNERESTCELSSPILSELIVRKFF